MIALITFVLLSGTLSSISISQLGKSSNNFHPAKVVQAGLSGNTQVGIDCGLGSTIQTNNATFFPVAPSEADPSTATAKSSCTWIGDVSGGSDGTNEPLVSDQDEGQSLTSQSIGGGFTASVIILQNRTASQNFINGFDLQVHWDPKILRAVKFDQQNEPNWTPYILLNPVRTIDNANGAAELAQVISSTAIGNFTLFRIRFDVVGVGTTGLTLTDVGGGITNPGVVVHTDVPGSFNSETVFDPGNTLNWSASFTNSTPILPGSPSTFQATVSGGTTTPYSYNWQFNSCNYNFTATAACVFKSEATGNPVTITMPNTAPGFRVDLQINDSATPTPHSIHLVRSIPFAAGTLRDFTSPSNTFAVNATQTFVSSWVGGTPPYTENVRFCPGTGSASNIICTRPNPTITDTAPTQTMSQSVSYKLSGVYTNTLSITDSQLAFAGGANTATLPLAVNVTGGTQAYTIAVSASPTKLAPNAQVTITSRIVYATGYPAAFESTAFSYTISFGDGTTAPTTSGTSSYTTTHSYSSSGNFTIRVTVRETSTRAVSQIIETNYSSVSVYPDITGTFTPSSSTAQTGQTVTFQPSISGGTGTYTYSWDFGDGSTSTSANPSHTYTTPGTYNVTLTVTDPSGRSLVSAQTVTINATQPPTSWLLYAVVGIVVAAVVIGALLFLRKKRSGKIQPA